MKIAALALTSILMTGCSLSESGGRKALEQNAFQYAGVSASAHLETCSRDIPKASNWVLLDRNPQAELFTLEDDSAFALRVKPVRDLSFACNFKFTSAQELFEKSEAAVDLTLYQLSLGEFTPPKAR